MVAFTGLTALVLRRHLASTTLDLTLEDGRSIQFDVVPWESGSWPSPGLEAYLIPGTLRDAGQELAVMLKAFRFDVPIRRARTQFLIERIGSDLRRAKDPSLFVALPFAQSATTPFHTAVLTGHFSRQIDASPDFAQRRRLASRDMRSWECVPLTARIEVAISVAEAVAAFERLEFVHGDLAAANLLVCQSSDGAAKGVLCDYDGFYHPGVALLPRSVDGVALRPLGTPGYRHPDFHFRASVKGAEADDLFVSNDRFAMAVLICELILWSSGLGRALGRDTLLGDAAMRTRSLDDVEVAAPGFSAAFPDGAELLSFALAQTGWWDEQSATQWAKRVLPGPADWVAILRGLSA